MVDARSRQREHRPALCVLACLSACLLSSSAGCASIPKGRYGVKAIEWKGPKRMSTEALEPCLITKPRERFELRLGLGSTSCGEPPFDEHTPKVRLWRWPWTNWSLYDSAVFDVDQKRILRWYAARGFYQARILDVDYSVDGKPVESPDVCGDDHCALTIQVELVEGQPVQATSVEIAGIAQLPPELQRRLQKMLQLRTGMRFDEAQYAADKDSLLMALRDDGYARAEVHGQVDMDRDRLAAHVRYLVQAGPLCRFGQVRVVGNAELDAGVITRTAGIPSGKPYDQRVVTDSELAVYSLGVFSTVRIDPEPNETGEVVNLVLRVTPGRRAHWLIGVGMMSGSLQRATSDETQSVPEWDAHLRFAYHDDDFLGGMRKLRLEDRPRLILLRDFPQVPQGGPALGNAVITSFEQPSFIESRTVFFNDNQWDYGPDPFTGWFRHDLAVKVGLRRKFYHQRLELQVALEHDLYEITSAHSARNVSSYRLPFAEQAAHLDLRDNPQRPTRGFYFAATVQEAVRLGYGSWDYVRVLPEARAYQRLLWRIVLAERLAFGALFILDRAAGLDSVSSALGPQTYRLRGGGATSDRGFAAGRLGDGIDGGIRRWESSLELRVPITHDIGLALFFDAGDVSRNAHVRFDHLNAATGLGLRYFTPFAPIRFDAGWRIPGWQVIGGPEPVLKTSALPSAVHLTIGESF